MIIIAVLVASIVVGVVAGLVRRKRGSRSYDELTPVGLFFAWFLGIGVAANGFVFAFLLGICLPDNQFGHDVRPLASISKLTGAEKPFYIGSNYEDGSRVLNYIDNGKKVTTLSNVTEEDDYYKLFLKGDTAQVDLVTSSKFYWIVAPFPLIPTGHTTYEFTVPKGTVLEGFSLSNN